MRKLLNVYNTGEVAIIVYAERGSLASFDWRMSNQALPAGATVLEVVTPTHRVVLHGLVSAKLEEVIAEAVAVAYGGGA